MQSTLRSLLGAQQQQQGCSSACSARFSTSTSFTGRASYRWTHRTYVTPRAKLAQDGLEASVAQEGAASQRRHHQQANKKQPADDRLITAKIKHCSSVEALQLLVQRYSHALNHIHVSAAITKCAHLAPAAALGTGEPSQAAFSDVTSTGSSTDGSGSRQAGHTRPWRSTAAAAAAAAPALVQLLLPLVDRHLPAFEPRHLSNILWALATLQQPLPHSWLNAYLARCHTALATFGTQDLSNLLWALGRLQHAPDTAFQEAFWAHSQHLLARFRPQELSSTLYAAARLQLQPPAAWLQAWQAAALQQAGSMSAQALSNSMWSLAQLRQAPEPVWLQEMVAACLLKLPSFDAHHVGMLLTGLAALPPELQQEQRQALLQAASSRWQYMGGQGLANCALAVARLRLQPDDAWLAGLSEAALSLPAQLLGPQDVVGLTTALGQLSATSAAAAAHADELLQHCVPHAASTWGSQDLQALVLAVAQARGVRRQQGQQQEQEQAELEEQQGQQRQRQQEEEASVLQQLLSSLQQQLPSLSAPKLSQLIWGLALLASQGQALPAQLVTGVAAAAAAAQGMGRQQVPQLLWGLAHLKPAVRLQPEQRAALLQAAQRHVGSLAAGELAVVLSSLYLLGFAAGTSTSSTDGAEMAAGSTQDSSAVLPGEMIRQVQQQASRSAQSASASEAARLAVAMARCGIPPADDALVQVLQQALQEQPEQLSLDDMVGLLLAVAQWQQQLSLQHHQQQKQQLSKQRQRQQQQEIKQEQQEIQEQAQLAHQHDAQQAAQQAIQPQQQQQQQQQQQGPQYTTYGFTRVWRRLEALAGPGFSTEEWCRLLWALGSVQVRPSQALVQACLTRLHQRLPNLQGPHLARLMMGLAKMHAPVPGGWLADAMYCLGPQLQQCSAKQLLGVLRAVGQFGYKQKVDGGAFSRAWLAAAEQQVAQLDVARSTQLLLQLSASGWQLPDSFLQQVMQRHSDVLPDAGPVHVRVALWALGRWPGMSASYGPCQLLLPGLVAAAERHMGCYSPNELIWVVKAVAQLQYQPPDSFLQAVYCQVASSMGQYNGRLAVALIWPLAKLDCRPEEAWLAQLAGCISSSMEELRPRQLANVLCAFARFGYNPGQAWLGRFTRQVDQSAGMLAALDHNHIQWAWLELSDTIAAAHDIGGGGGRV